MTIYNFTLVGDPICWRSMFQPDIVLSTIEVIFTAATKVLKEKLWLRFAWRVGC